MKLAIFLSSLTKYEGANVEKDAWKISLCFVVVLGDYIEVNIENLSTRNSKESKQGTTLTAFVYNS